MTVREYIGARYIPIYVGEWDNTREYEALNIVQFAGASYTSLQAVPVGIDIYNEDYWLCSGNYNAQIEQYRQELRQYDRRITKNADDIADEIEARTAADTALEAVLPIADFSSENTVSDAIEAEATARANAVSAEATARENAVSAEATARENADTALSTRLDTAEDFIGINIGKTIKPNYMGDFIDTKQFGCVSRVGNYFYCFCTDNYDESNSDIFVFDIEGNSLSYAYHGKQIGHANSVAYNPNNNHFYIAPMATYYNGVDTPINAVIEYSTDFAVKNVINAPMSILSVSYDPVADVLYAIGYQSATKFVVYELENNTFTQIAEIQENMFDRINDNSVWQDCAIYNNILYLVKPEGTMYVIELSESPNIIETLRIENEDIGSNWHYGEVEGIEFDNSGRLYNARIFVHSSSGVAVANAFVTELNTKEYAQPVSNYTQAQHNTLILSADTQAKFKLGRNEIRTLNQLNNRWDIYSTVQIPSGTTVNDVFCRLLRLRFTLDVRGTYKTPNWVAYGCAIGLHIEPNAQFTFTSPTAQTAIDTVNYFSEISIRNRGTIVIPSNMTNLIRTGYIGSFIGITGMNNPASFNIEGVAVNSACFMVGTHKIDEW